MSTFTPNIEINPLVSITTIDREITVHDVDIEYSIGDEYGSVSIDIDDYPVSFDLDVEHFEDLTPEDVDNVLSALVKYHPEHMSKRLFASTPTDADAIKSLMERMDELAHTVNCAPIELEAIRRAAGMLAGAPTTEQTANK